MKLIRLYLLGYKGFKVLNGLTQCEIQSIRDVVIARDKNIINDYSSEIESFCKTHNINCYYRNSESFVNVDYSILIGWRWLLKENNDKLIVIHDSLLPRLRGFNPLVTALINGDEIIGATALLATSQFDKGPIILQESLRIEYPIKINKATEYMSDLYLSMVKTLLHKIKNDTITLTEQDESKATYSLWRDDDDYWIDWTWNAQKIKRFIDAVGYPYLGAKSTVNGKLIRIFEVDIVNDDVIIENRTPGKVLFKDDIGLTVVCGSGLLKIKQLYMDNNEFFDFTKYFRLKFK